MDNEYLVNSADLTSVADAIRAKGGMSGALTFPGGFVAAVGAIQAGSGGGDDNVIALIERNSSFNMPDGVAKIGSYAFAGFSNYDIDNLPDTVKRIEMNGFYGSSISISKLPDGLTYIGNSAFENCSKLALASLPNNLGNPGYNTFKNCPLITISELPDSLTVIPTRMFDRCSAIPSMKFHAGITQVGESAFYMCTSLRTVTFYGTPKKIFANAFGGCTNLGTINVPWAEGEVAGAPWAAPNATINYNYTGG